MSDGRPRQFAMRATLVCFVALLTVAVTSTPAAAHAKVVRTTPANGASIDGKVKAVTVVFDDPVRLVPHALVVTGGTGAPLPTGAPQVVGDRTLTAPLHDRLVAGRYLVAWRILSDDGHVETGSFAFAVGVPGAAPAATPAMPPAPGQPVWPVVVAAALAAVAVLGGSLVVVRGLRAVRAAAPGDAYPIDRVDAESVREHVASRRRTT
jgi:methionine-rich copper-binding protein CopC